MPRTVQNALNATTVKKPMAPGTYSDGRGLTLLVDAQGSKRWFQRLSIVGKQRNMGLGGYPAVSLDEARRLAFANHQEARAGGDPIEARRVAKLRGRMPAAPSFREVAEKIIQQREPTWAAGAGTQWRQSLENHAYPLIGNRLCYAVSSADILAILEPLWATKPRMAAVIKQRVGVVLDYAVVNGWAQANPSLGVEKALGRRPKGRHHGAVPHGEIPAFLAILRASRTEPASKLALEFLILTAARSGEVRGMTWAEVDLETATWTVPEERMKARREHRAPLSPRALEILREAQSLPGATGKGGSLVFPSGRGQHRRLGAMTFVMVLRRFGHSAQAHGFRSSFKVWSLEVADADWAASEAALAHQLGNTVEASYARTDLLEKRRPLMNAWAEYCTRPV